MKDIKDMTSTEIVAGVRDGSITSEHFETNEKYMEWANKDDRVIPRISDELIAQVNRIFAHGPSRAKNHDQRFGQWLVNKVRTKYQCEDQAATSRVLFNLENQEIFDMIKDYND